MAGLQEAVRQGNEEEACNKGRGRDLQQGKGKRSATREKEMERGNL